MLDSIKVLQAIANQNVPTNCIDYFFSGEFKAEYDNVVISYDDRGYKRNINFTKVVIETSLSTTISVKTGRITTALYVSMHSDNTEVFNSKLNRDEYVSAFAKIASQIQNTYRAKDTNRNLKLWEIVDKF